MSRVAEGDGGDAKASTHAFVLRTNFDIFVQHPFLEKQIPVFIANFVLMEYGLGAIFGCPAHDQRDLDFANTYNLDVIQVVEKKNADKSFQINNVAMLENGVMINSDFLNGLDNEAAKNEVLNRLEKKGLGNKKVNYKLRDWGVSRQRYWGCPIPMMYREDGSVVPVQEKDLPVLLPVLNKNNPNPTKEEEKVLTSDEKICNLQLRSWETEQKKDDNLKTVIHWIKENHDSSKVKLDTSR